LANVDEEESSDSHFCKICSRSLANNDAYARHLASELHFKRSAKSVSPTTGPVETAPRKRTPIILEMSTVVHSERLNIQDSDKSEAKSASKVVSSGQMITCATCQSMVNRAQFGKHLVIFLR
jgi:hypothetical protein